MIVVTIFSMCADYAVGGTRFRVFFVITVPILSISVLLSKKSSVLVSVYFISYY